jgi:hypothetical protein
MDENTEDAAGGFLSRSGGNERLIILQGFRRDPGQSESTFPIPPHQTRDIGYPKLFMGGAAGRREAPAAPTVNSFAAATGAASGLTTL